MSNRADVKMEGKCEAADGRQRCGKYHHVYLRENLPFLCDPATTSAPPSIGNLLYNSFVDELQLNYPGSTLVTCTNKPFYFPPCTTCVRG